MQTNIEQWPVKIELPVYWGDMDAFQHVNNVCFIRWFECVRIEYFRQIADVTMLSNKQIGPILAQVSANYLMPLTFPDSIIAAANVNKIGNTSFHMEYLIKSKNTNQPAATGQSVIVMINYQTGEKVPVKNILQDKIESLQSTIGTLL